MAMAASQPQTLRAVTTSGWTIALLISPSVWAFLPGEISSSERRRISHWRPEGGLGQIAE